MDGTASRLRARAWMGGAAAVALSGCFLLGQPAGGPTMPGATSRPTAGPADAALSLEYRMGVTWDGADNRYEIYDQRRWLWISLRDAQGSAPAGLPQVAITGPVDRTPPKIFPVQLEGGRHFARVRFYDTGGPYKLTVSAPAATGTRSVSAILPEVQPALRQAGTYGLEYLVSPGIGAPLVAAKITLEAQEGAAPATLSVPPRIKVINPCGWGPDGTASAVFAATGAYAWELPATDVIGVTGNYRIKVYPLSDPATYVEYLYETR